jgi:hypothetical protein
MNAAYPAGSSGYQELTAWPLQSPDLTPTDFFLWGHLKSLPGLLKILWHNFKQLWQWSMPTALKWTKAALNSYCN